MMNPCSRAVNLQKAEMNKLEKYPAKVSTLLTLLPMRVQGTGNKEDIIDDSTTDGKDSED
ncbi:hypothetical protein J7E78_00240 [Paenibacillus polymyxa]|nr:hypothetical protein [Paenibacillus polymyxa]